jgi:hypothetical protein
MLLRKFRRIIMVTLGAMQGWQCPVCGRVLAPFMMECPCKGNPQSATTTSTGTAKVAIDGKELFQPQSSDARNGYASY